MKLKAKHCQAKQSNENKIKPFITTNPRESVASINVAYN
jgi:hypothetical protein